MDQRQKKADEVSDAMQRVLLAERQAEADLLDVERQAEIVVRNARARAREIRQRTNDRIRRLQTSYADKVNRELLEIREQSNGNSKIISGTIDDKALIDAIERLADKLTGAENENAE